MPTLPKDERLHGLKATESLFRSGKGLFAYPLRAVYGAREDGGEETRILVSVPKKKFKRAVARNNIKRKVREAYRLNKAASGCDLAFIYVSDENLPYLKIEAAVKKILRGLLNQKDAAKSKGADEKRP